MLLRCSHSGEWGDAVARVRNEPSPGTVPSVGTGSFAFPGTPSCQTRVRGVWSGVISQDGSCVLSPQKALSKFQNPARDLTLNNHRAAAPATPISAH